jgi:molybdate transport system ATP-binding protein
LTEPAALRAFVEGQVGQLRITADIEATAGPLVLVGPNGAGKTTILLMLLGIVPLLRGRIELSGSILLDTSAGVEIPVEHRQLGYVPQDYALFPHLTVRQNVEFALGSSPTRGDRKTRSQRADALLADLGLDGLADRRATALSGGEKQRVALARALSVSPRALLLDEPLAALDTHARQEVRGFLAAYLARISMPTVVVTHDAADARVLGHCIAVLEAGGIVQTGTWSELEARPASPFVKEFVAAGRQSNLAAKA